LVYAFVVSVSHGNCLAHQSLTFSFFYFKWMPSWCVLPIITCSVNLVGYGSTPNIEPSFQGQKVSESYNFLGE